MRISIGSYATNKKDKYLGLITNVYAEDNKTILVLDDDYEIPVSKGEVEEVFDLVRGLHFYRLKMQ
jgi:hypothetical protein